jgi:hypothetical protein
MPCACLLQVIAPVSSRQVHIYFSDPLDVLNSFNNQLQDSLQENQLQLQVICLSQLHQLSNKNKSTCTAQIVPSVELRAKAIRPAALAVL